LQAFISHTHQELIKPAQCVLDVCLTNVWRAMSLQSIHLNWLDERSTRY